jgi:hypothetical protein
MERQHEKYILDQFRVLFSDFPIGEIIHTDKPDFLIKVDNKTIGIEHTQIFNDIHIDDKNNNKRKESIRRMVGNSLSKKLGLIFPRTFILSIDFSEKEFANNDITRIVSHCFESLREFDFTKFESDSIDFENVGQFPDEINKFNVFMCDKLYSSFYSESAGGGVPNLTDFYLNRVLSKKDKALEQYQFSDEYWLLIESDSFYSDAFNEIQLSTIETSFNRVFIYRHNRHEVIILK